jgi:putative RNA 2'-phosphotransferase
MLAYVLGRRPDEFGLVPDPEGFVRIKDLLKAFSEEPGWKHVRRAGIDELLISLPDAPVERVGNRIRAVDRRHLCAPHAVRDVPKLLYTCVRRRAHAVASSKGLVAGDRGWLVLSADRDMALRLGKRIDSAPVILTVHTGSRAARSVIFFKAGETLYTARSLPPECLSGPPLPKEKKLEAKTPPKPLAPKEPGSFHLDLTRPRPGGRAQPSPDGQTRRKGRRKDRKARRERPPWRS